MATIFNPNQQEDENQDNVQQPGMIAGGAPTTPVGQSPIAPTPQGSGRFTNLQKYLQANAPAGQQLASGIGQKVKKDIDVEKQKGQDFASQLSSGIEKSREQFQAGKGFLGQLQGIGQNIQGATGGEFYNKPQELGIEQFVQQPGYGQFQDIRQGRGVNESLLAAQQQGLSGASQAYQNLANQALGKVGTESGRFDLLKQAYGGNFNPQYSTGQQRLDQVILAREGLGGLQQTLGEDVKSARSLAEQSRKLGSEVGTTRLTEQQLMGDLAKQAGLNENQFMQMLESYVPSANVAREQEYTDFVDKLNSLKSVYNTQGAASTSLPAGTVQKMGAIESSTVPGKQFTQQELEQLGVTGPSRVYNVFKDLQAGNISQKGLQAQTGADIVADQDLARYQALADIMGMSPEARRLTQTGQIGDAVVKKSLTGETLGSRISDAQKAFDKTAAETKLRGDARWGTADYWRQMDAERKAGTSPQISGATYQGANLLETAMEHPLTKLVTDPLQSLTSGLVSSKGFQANRNDPGMLVALTNELAAQTLLNQGKDPIVGRMAGAAPDVGTTWRDRSEQEMWKNFASFLQDQGYANTIGGAVAAPNKDVAQLLGQIK